MTLLLAAAHAQAPDLEEPLRTGSESPHDAAVVVGIEDYVFLPDIPYARRDATLVRDWLISTRGVPPERVKVLEGGAREQILAAVEQASTATGTVWVYFAGHGVASAGSGERLLLGDDTRPVPEAFDARGVALAEVQRVASAHGAEVVTLVDACFSGTGRGGEQMVTGTRFAVPEWAASPAAHRLEFSAAGPDQFARPLDGVQHGAFTWFLVGALRGWADGEVDGARDGVVSAREANVYVGRALDRVGLTEQDPVLSATTPAEWTLARGVDEPPPELEALRAAVSGARVERPVEGPAPAPEARWPGDLDTVSADLGVVLPLRKTLLGYRDAEDERVRKSTFAQLARATPKGRTGGALRTAGLVGTVVGWGATMGGALGLALNDGDNDFVAPTAAGGALLVAGIAVTATGASMVTNSVPTR